MTEIAIENIKNIRNFVIIAHIDAGKSTLADRLLEVTKTIDSRKMKPQYLDQLDLERERGITIKMAPVRMKYFFDNKEYILNLIDTPGHSDFSYEVSRALAAVEGAILLVDATKGIQAQTLSNFYAAQKAGLKIIGAINKVDLFNSNDQRLKEMVKQTANLINSSPENIHLISAKTGFGIDLLLKDIIQKLNPPQIYKSNYNNECKALIFDSIYDENKGVIAYVRIFKGNFKPQENVKLFSPNKEFKIKELGYFSPELKPAKELDIGEIGYIATGIKEPSLIYVGDTILKNSNNPLPGYKKVKSVVFVSFYPDKNTKFEELKKAFEKLHLSDAALNFEIESNDALGRGLKVGFLGKLHFDIIATRLQREFNLDFFTTFPSIQWKIKDEKGERYINDPNMFPDKPTNVWQQMINLQIITPPEYLNAITKLQNIFELKILETKVLNNQILIIAKMPLLELIYDFDDKLKSVSSGFASFSYEINGEEKATAAKLEILINNTLIKPLTRIVPEKDIEKEARNSVLKLKEVLPKEQFAQAIQAKAFGRIIARENIPALRKDVTGYLYGGDRTRKMKLWKKQQEGKKKLKSISKTNISPEVFKQILKK
ncbi:MAG: translation elongation factor 4 [Patescibacteria group bacterium]|nr:translation elongation factor 4 [Patescibacteria group bacterium]MCX7589378.1 translation elongation factor 4 [Patescibacteria group bacterium]MDW8279879.1 translation elongation factor 4 [bacterium]